MGCGGSKSDGETFKIVLEAPTMTTLVTESSPELGSADAAFNAIEEKDEKELHRASHADLTATLLAAAQMDYGAVVETYVPATIAETLAGFKKVAAGLPSTTNGKLSAPLDADELTPALATKLYDRLLEPECPTTAVSKRLVFKVVLAAIDHLDKGGAVAQLPLPAKDGRQVVVGDTHGQLQDVLTILMAHGVPSEKNRYLFNGDIADRGPNAVEIYLLALLFMLTVPNSTWVTRGNHEARDINERPAGQGGGFRDEVLKKYDEETFELFQMLFWHLPIAAMIGGQIFVVHGGLSREVAVKVERLKQVDYKKDIPERPSNTDENLLFDCMWSDPGTEPGAVSGQRGDTCIKWGPDVTKAFLEANGCDLVIRSHQLPPGGRGYSLLHGDQVLTIFSASNYGGCCDNMGAILIIPSNGSLDIKEHKAESLATIRANEAQRKVGSSAKANQSLNNVTTVLTAKKGLMNWRRRASTHAAEERERAMKANLLSSIRSLVVKQRKKLQVAFDAKHKSLVANGQAEAAGGLLPLSEWRSILVSTLELEIDWETLPQAIQLGLAPPIKAPPEDEAPLKLLDPSLYPAVHYRTFLERFQVELKMEGSTAPPKVDGRLLTVMYAQAVPLRKALVLAAAQQKAVGSTGAVSKSVFVATMGALVAAVAAGERDDSPPDQSTIAALAYDVAPENEAGGILYGRLIDSLVVVDTMPPSEVEEEVAAAPTGAAEVEVVAEAPAIQSV